MAKILVIDDDEALRRTMCISLGRDGHEIIEAIDGIEGLQKFHSEKPDVVISDIMMPHRDGIETLQAILDEGTKVGLIAISGGGVRGGELYLSVAARLGADAIVQKPFRPTELRDAVDLALQRARDAV